jgi:hypothetical protein
MPKGAPTYSEAHRSAARGSVLSGFHLFFCHCAETLSYTALNLLKTHL